MNRSKFRSVSLLALTVTAASLGLIAGCGGGGGGSAAVTTTTVAATTTIPVTGANSPFIGVTMTATCANGAVGSGTVGTSASPGEGSITVNGQCTTPILISATGAGKMRPIGAKADGSEDVPYDPAINLPLGNVITTVPSTGVPVNPVTALVAGQVALSSLASETASSVALKKLSVANALGLPVASLDADYRDAALARTAAVLAEVASLAAINAATAGALPGAVASGTSLGAYIQEKLTAQVAIAGSGTLVNAATLAAALKLADAKLDATTVTADLSKIDNDAGRVHNLIATYAAGATSAADALNKIASAATAAANATSPSVAQMNLLIDVAARVRESARSQMRNSAAKIVADVVLAGNSTTSNSVAVAQAAASNLLDAQFTLMAQTGAKPADLAAKAKAAADSIAAAIKTDLTASSRIFGTAPPVGNVNAAAALVGQAMSAAAGITAASAAASPADVVAAAANNLRVVSALKDIVPPRPAASAISQLAYQAAFQAAIGAVAGAANPATLNAADSATRANLNTVATALQLALLTAINSAGDTSDRSLVTLAQQLARTALGTTALSFSSSVTLAAVPSTLPTTTSTTSTSSTTLANTSSTSAGTTTSTSATTTTTAPSTSTTTTSSTTTTTLIHGSYFGIAGDAISFNGTSCLLSAFSTTGCTASSTVSGTESISFSMNPAGSLGDPGTTSFGLEVAGVSADSRILRIGISGISLLYSNRNVWLIVPSSAEMVVYGRDTTGLVEANITLTSNIDQYIQISSNTFTFNYGALLTTLNGLGGALFTNLDIRTGTFTVKTVLSSNFVIAKTGGIPLSNGNVSVTNTSFTVTGPMISGKVSLH